MANAQTTIIIDTRNGRLAVGQPAENAGVGEPIEKAREYAPVNR